MSEETKDIEETKVAEEKKMETEQTILSQPTEKKAAETVTQIQQSVEIPEQKEKSEPEPKRSFIRSRKKAAASREEQILSRIKDEDLMKYLEMEHERLEMILGYLIAEAVLAIIINSSCRLYQSVDCSGILIGKHIAWFFLHKAEEGRF